MTGTIIVLILIDIVLSIVPAFLARNAGKDFVRWWLYGLFLLPVALVHSLLYLTAGPKKTCGYCRRQVPYSAKHCPTCGYEFIDFS